MKIETVFENEAFIAFNKPSGLLTIPDRFDPDKPCLQKIAEQKSGKLYTVHRLDRDTSGLILFAKNENSHRYLSGLFQSRNIQKYYQALVHGIPHPEQGDIRQSISEHPIKKGRMIINKNGKPAHTAYKLLKTWNSFSLAELQLFTGRTHQIRVHLQYLGHPVLCDPLYGNESQLMLSSIKKHYKLSKHTLEERPILSRLALHASCLIFEDETGKPLEIRAALPKDMAATISQLDKQLG